jgi:hypothetical protein
LFPLNSSIFPSSHLDFLVEERADHAGMAVHAAALPPRSRRCCPSRRCVRGGRLLLHYCAGTCSPFFLRCRCGDRCYRCPD